MVKKQWKGALVGAAALLLLPAVALAVPGLAFSPAEVRIADMGGGGSASFQIDVLITGLEPGTAVAAYDLGIIYDPAVMVMTNFIGFTDRLGVEGDTVFSEDQLGDVTSLWDYRQPSTATGLGAYEGPVLGTPDITGQGVINQGSLRFSQASSLEQNALLALQDYSINSTLILFSIQFTVPLTGQNKGTQLRFVDDTSYAGFPGTGSLLDVKLSTDADPFGLIAHYLPKTNGSVQVPEPGILALTLLGLGGALAGRHRRRPGRQPI